MGFIQEFKEFALKGSLFDTAVGIIMGTEIGKLVGSLVTNVMMPIVGTFTKVSGGLGALSAKFPDPTDTTKTLVEVPYGKFLDSFITFLIIAFCVFMMIKAMNSMRKKQAAAPPPPPPADVTLLGEIRDLLKNR